MISDVSNGKPVNTNYDLIVPSISWNQSKAESETSDVNAITNSVIKFNMSD